LLPYYRPAGAGTDRLMRAYISKLFLFHWKNTKNIRYTCSKWGSPGWGGSLVDRLFKLNEISPGWGDTRRYLNHTTNKKRLINKHLTNINEKILILLNLLSNFTQYTDLNYSIKQNPHNYASTSTSGNTQSKNFFSPILHPGYCRATTM
jgi:hypothetical protein